MTELDIRPVVPREKHPTIMKTFDDLQSGEAFQLINDHDPVPLYYQFQAEKANQFGWEYIERGPEVWRVNISKSLTKNVSKMITKDMKISKLLNEFPQTLEVLVNFSTHFKKLNNKILRKTLASRVNVEQAAGIAGVNLVLLLNELNKSINADNAETINEESTEEKMTQIEKPELLKNKSADKIQKMDVRSIIDSGKDPFLEIMAKVKSLKDEEVFHLINSFEPIPLYSVMQNKGFEHWTENDGSVFNVFFYKNDINKSEVKVESNISQVSPADFENVIELDVRELAPPEPMMKILENISRVDEKTVMVVHHHREPMMLYPKLEERGYTAITNKIDENYFKVVIMKKRND